MVHYNDFCSVASSGAGVVDSAGGGLGVGAGDGAFFLMTFLFGALSALFDDRFAFFFGIRRPDFSGVI
jgi:hypothetical protein